MTLIVIDASTPAKEIENCIAFLRNGKPEGQLPLASHLSAALAEVVRLRAQFGESLGEDFGGRRITLCGSARFARAYREWTARLMIDESAMVWTAPLVDTLTDEQKVRIDQLWFAQIAASDAIFVLNVNGYIGPSTAAEIAFARDRGIAVRFLSGEFPDWTEADCRFAGQEAVS